MEKRLRLVEGKRNLETRDRLKKEAAMASNHILDEHPLFEVDAESREIILSQGNRTVAVQFDMNSQLITFHVRRYFDNVDHLGQKVRIHYLNSAAKGDIVEAYSVAEDPTDSDYLLVTWLISASATQAAGQLDIAIEFYESDDTQCYYRWFTKPAAMNIAKGILVSDKSVGITSEILLRIEAALEKINNYPSSSCGLCATAGATAVKTVSGLGAGFAVEEQTTLYVKFAEANLANAPKLLVNGQEAPVYDWQTGSNAAANAIGACTHHFVMLSGIWVLLNPVTANEAPEKGEDGRGIVSVTRTSGTGAAGTVDTYTITYTDGTTSTFQVWNGENGTNGGYYTPSVSNEGELVFTASKQGMPPVVPIDLHEYISTILPGGYCSTGAEVADKIEIYISKEIVAGSLVSIQFANTNTANNPTLTVNGVKAAIVGGNGEAISPAMLGAGERVFLYTTSQKWVLINPQVSALPTATASDAGKVATVGSNGAYGLAYPQMPVVATTVTNIEMQPNVRYRWGVVSSLTLSFADEIPGIVNEYCGEFYSGSPATNFMCPASVNWVTPLNIESGKRYEFSIVNEIGVMSGV